MPAEAPEAGLRAQVRQLELRLADLQRERDDLARDVENLCMSSGPGLATFDTSSVLQERIYFTGEGWLGGLLHWRSSHADGKP